MRLAEELFLAPCRDEPALRATHLTPNQQIACDAITLSLRPGAILLLDNRFQCRGGTPVSAARVKENKIDFFHPDLAILPYKSSESP